jgi:hypothetical protein
MRVLAPMLLLLAVLFDAGAARAQPGGWRGVYVAGAPLNGPGALLPDAAYRGPAGGVYLRLVWAQLEPAPGRYDWRLLDRELARARRANRRVSLSVIAGGRAPPWLSGAGVRVVEVMAARGGRARRACGPIAVPVPWDAGYQRAYARLMAAVATRVRAGGAWDAVRIVKLTGIGRVTEELRLPITTPAGAECGGDPSGQWRAAGYTADRAVAAWQGLADAAARAFPGKLLAQDVLDRNDFPAARGPGDDPSVKRRIVAAGVRAYPGRFAVQWDGLNLGGPLAGAVADARAQGALVGWQTNAFRGLDGAGCNPGRRSAPQPCDAAGFDAMLRRGTAAGGGYLEVWEDDAQRFPDAVARAERALATGR